MTEAAVPEPIALVQTARNIRWSITGALTGYLDRENVRFGVVVQHIFDEWQVLGFATLIPDDDDGRAGLERVLARHAHQQVGAFRELSNAQWAACDFLVEAPVPTELCGCKAIEPTVTTPLAPAEP